MPTDHRLRSAAALALAGLAAAFLPACSTTREVPQTHAQALEAAPAEAAPANATPVAAAAPINAICPIGREGVTESGGTVVHNGHTVGFCCDGCKEYWTANMTNAERDAFVNETLAAR